MGYSRYFPHNLMDMGSLLGTIRGNIPNHKRDHYVHCAGSLNKANLDSNSYVYHLEEQMVKSK